MGRRIVATAFATLAEAGTRCRQSQSVTHWQMPITPCTTRSCRCSPDAHATSDRLKGLGIKLALITNGGAEPQRAKVVRFALEHRFDHNQIEGEHGFGKPEERAYTHAMEMLGVRPHETWMVCDNLEWEIAAPQRLGIYAIWHDGYGVGLPSNSPNPSRPDHPPPVEIAGIAERLAISAL